MKKEPVIAVAGATGLVGNEIVAVLDQSKLPWKEVRLLASENSVGELYKVGDDEAEVELLEEESFQEVDIAIFATAANLSEKFVPAAVKSGAVCIDNSGCFAMKPGVALVVPEVNLETITKDIKIIANPNPAVIQLVPVLKVIDDLAGLSRVVVSTYQAVSGAGKSALDELWEQTLAIFNQRELPIECFPHQIAFNCIPQIDLVLEDGYTKEEYRIVNESRKILGKPDLRITATAVRVPVLYGHAESVNVETERPLAPADLVAAFGKAASILAYPEVADYPMQLPAAGSDEIHVGRIRKDESVEHGLNLWVVADNVRKGAALNAVQIARTLIERYGA